MQEYYKKKTCERCRALRVGYRGDPSECQLGYDIDPLQATPREPCPKPLTYLDFIELLQEKHR